MKRWIIAIGIAVIVIAAVLLTVFLQKKPACHHVELDVNHRCLQCGKTLNHHLFRKGSCIAPGCEAVTEYEYEAIPDEYRRASRQKGRVERLEYDARAYSAERYNQDFKGKAQAELISHKECYVYLPYGYDEARQYNILYLFHGSGGNAKDWLNGEVVTLLDNLIEKGDCEALIVVSATFYYPDVIDSKLLQESRYDQNYYWYELRNDLIPAVEARYSTYAARNEAGAVTIESIIASRDHRAIAGCSRGSRTTVASGMMKCLDCFAYFGCFEGITDTGAEILASIGGEAMAAYPVQFMYNGQGTEDFTRDQHMGIYRELVALDDDRLREGRNLCMVDKYFLGHTGSSFYLDLYNFVRVDLFQHQDD